MRALWNNEIIDATLTPSTENPNFEVENIQDTRLSRYFRTVLDAAQDIVIDAGGSTTASYFAILNHNLSSGATIKLQGNNTDAWGAPAFDEALTWNVDMIVFNFTEVSYNFWRLYIDDPANPDNYIKIGHLYLGTFLQMPYMKVDQVLTVKTMSKVKISESGQAYGDEKYSFRNPKINFPRISQTQRLAIQAMFDTVKNVRPFILLIWANELDFEKAVYCVIDQDKLTWKRQDNVSYKFDSISIKFMECF